MDKTVAPDDDPTGDIDSYLAAVPEPARSTLEQVRKAIRAAVPEADESISYRIPTFKFRGRPLIYFAAFKNHCSLFPMTDFVWETLGGQLESVRAFRTGKGTVQFPTDSAIPDALVTKIVKLRIKENADRLG